MRVSAITGTTHPVSGRYNTRVLAGWLGIAALAALWISPSNAEFPEDRPLRVITPYGAGGGIDVAARILSAVGAAWVGTRIDVVNMPGAGGLTAANFVREADADGYTLMVSDYTPLVTLPLREDTPYAASDWVPLVQVTEIAPTFVVLASAGHTTIAALLEDAAQRPRKIAATHGTFMSSSHLPLLRLEQRAGVEFNHVPTSGGGETFQFLLGNVVQLAVTTPATIAGPARAGRVIPIAVATAKRSAAFPDVPTLRESGFNIVMPVWYTIFASSDVSPDRARLLSERIVAAYASAEAQTLAARAGLQIEPVGFDDVQRIYSDTVEAVSATLANLQE